VVTASGQFLITCESSCLLVWNLEMASILVREFLPDVQQLLLWRKDRRLLVVAEESALKLGYIRKEIY
jgi:hypothetical protein